MEPLSPQQTRVLDLYEQGLSYKEIAAHLQRSIHTVKTHARNIVKKTGATSLRNAAWIRRQPRPA